MIFVIVLLAVFIGLIARPLLTSKNGEGRRNRKVLVLLLWAALAVLVYQHEAATAPECVEGWEVLKAGEHTLLAPVCIRYSNGEND